MTARKKAATPGLQIRDYSIFTPAQNFYDPFRSLDLQQLAHAGSKIDMLPARELAYFCDRRPGHGRAIRGAAARLRARRLCGPQWRGTRRFAMTAGPADWRSTFFCSTPLFRRSIAFSPPARLYMGRGIERYGCDDPAWGDLRCPRPGARSPLLQPEWGIALDRDLAPVTHAADGGSPRRGGQPGQPVRLRADPGGARDFPPDRRDGREAVDLCTNSSPPWLLMDVSMPVMNALKPPLPFDKAEKGTAVARRSWP